MSDDVLAAAALDALFLQARTHNGWQARPVDASTLRRLYELTRMPPTSANCQPLRVVFSTTAESREKLRPALMGGNVDKTMAAPVTAILAADTRFYEHVPHLFPAVPGMGDMFKNMPAPFQERVRTLNTGLQIGYFLLAARALGLDVGPMGGFDGAKVDAAFFPEGRFTSLVLCNLGHGDPAKVHPRGPRLDFETACRIE